MILYCIYSNTQTPSSIEHLINKPDTTRNNVAVRLVPLEQLNNNNALPFGILAQLAQDFQLDVTADQSGFFITSRLVWQHFISTGEQHCLIMKDAPPAAELLQRIVNAIDQFPAGLEILSWRYYALG